MAEQRSYRYICTQLLHNKPQHLQISNTMSLFSVRFRGFWREVKVSEFRRCLASIVTIQVAQTELQLITKFFKSLFSRKRKLFFASTVYSALLGNRHLFNVKRLDFLFCFRAVPLDYRPD